MISLTNTSLKTNKTVALLVFLFSCVAYYVFAYHTLRTNFSQVLVLYTIVFIGFYVLYNYLELQYKTLFGIGLLFRLLFLFAIPNLSDDFYRFLWDGQAVVTGLNPYLILPENNPSLLNNGELLYQGMGTMNGSHFTCYPPLNQFAFAIAALFPNSSILVSTVVMRLTLILADMITLFYGSKLLRLLQINRKKIFLYFLNPFIVIELTGNLHFEGMMLAFIAASFFFLYQQKKCVSAVLFACSVSIKLIPILLLPVLYKKLGLQKLIIYVLVVALVNILLFLPFASTTLYSNFMSSIELYFQNFEFNASIYYLVREIGYWVKGYNIIQTVGKITPIIIVAITLYFSFIYKAQKKAYLFRSLLFVITSYYLLSSVVHPWYLALPLFFSLFTKYQFPLLWSFLIFLSYSAYMHSSYQENLWLVFLEYLFLFGYLAYELFFKKQKAIV